MRGPCRGGRSRRGWRPQAPGQGGGVELTEYWWPSAPNPRYIILRSPLTATLWTLARGTWGGSNQWTGAPPCAGRCPPAPPCSPGPSSHRHRTSPCTGWPPHPTLTSAQTDARALWLSHPPWWRSLLPHTCSTSPWWPACCPR